MKIQSENILDVDFNSIEILLKFNEALHLKSFKAKNIYYK